MNVWKRVTLCSKISKLFLFSKKKKNLVIRAGIHNIRECSCSCLSGKTDQTAFQKQSDLGLPCLS